MTAAELSALSDQQLSERVAVEVAGWNPVPHTCPTQFYPPGLHPMQNSLGHTLPRFATSADAVLPLLEKTKGDADITFTKHCGVQNYIVTFRDGWDTKRTVSPTLARCLCIALLVAKGAA